MTNRALAQPPVQLMPHVHLPEGCEAYANALILPHNLSWDDWAALMQSLEAEINRMAQRVSTVQWWLGDAINHGRATYGEMYAQWVDQTNYKYGSLANIKWVAEHVPPELRHPELSFYHHQIVAPDEVEDKETWLALAAENEWTGRELSREITRARVTEEGGDPDLYEAERDVGYAVSVFEKVTPDRWADVVWRQLLAPLRHMCTGRDYEAFLARLKTLMMKGDKT